MSDLLLIIGSILKNKEEEFAKDLHELSEEEEFNPMAFESLMDKIRTHVAEVGSGVQNSAFRLEGPRGGQQGSE